MEPGRVVAGKYRLNELLGVGGMASVWSATNVFTDRQFAVKIMLPTVARTNEVARRFLLEAKASARIDHPNIVEVIDVGQAEDGSLFLVMELLTGVSLETVIAQQMPRMRLYDFFIIMLDVARALAAAHERGVIHRDLKPTNVFLSHERLRGGRDGRGDELIIVPKLLDFGISKFLEEEGIESVTIAGTILGSPMYMSPEQARGSRSIDRRTDIFAFGAILFEALVGYRCFDATNFNALLIQVATKQPFDIDACAPHLPDAVRALVRGCLVVDRKRRIGSFDEITRRLEDLLPALEDDPETIAIPLPAASPGSEELDPRSGVGPRGGTPGPRYLHPRRLHGYYAVALFAVFAALAVLVAYTAWAPTPHAVVDPRAAARASAEASTVTSSKAPVLPAPPPALHNEARDRRTEPRPSAPPVVPVDALPTAERAAPAPSASSASVGTSSAHGAKRKTKGRLPDGGLSPLPD
ncbi:serine/threonine-protein kinase [Pendulispora albinea]|uniref:Serine/threonine protein kinase n=1 Tax=Pendulispora albinea TaxID=2741071 RepID=A0ABZ2LJM3_9BACT